MENQLRFDYDHSLCVIDNLLGDYDNQTLILRLGQPNISVKIK